MTRQRPVMLFTGILRGFQDAASHEAADAWRALEWACREGLHVVLCSHHTRAELEHIGAPLHRHLFIVENGGGITLPTAEPQGGGREPVESHGLLPLGRPYRDVVGVLRERASRLRLDVLGFDDLSPEQLAAQCGLSLDRARQAKRREFDEPFRILGGSPAAVSRLWWELRAAGLRCTPGAPFHHVTGGGGVRPSVDLLCAMHARGGVRPLTIGLGTDLRDRPLLRAVDVPVIVPCERNGLHPHLFRKLSNARVASPGAAGCIEAVADALASMGARVAMPHSFAQN